jgi:pimeloyl-ACP methyl ester carboxylesterase
MRDWTEITWSDHLTWVEVEGRPANVLDVGSGPPLVFVHGLSGSWQNWLENIPAFMESHRVIAMDLPGFGQSPMPREKITISGYGRWLDALLERLDVDAAAVVGNSMGGFIAAETAIKFPHRVERLALVSAAGVTIEKQRNDGLLRVLEVTENISQFAMAGLLSRADALIRRPRGRKALLWFVAAHPDELDPRLAKEQMSGANKPGFVPALDALTSYPIRDRLSDIGCPTWICWGPKDMLVPVKDAHVFDELIPDSRLTIYEDTGHVPMLERPERFNRDLADFLAEQAGSEAEREADAASAREPEPAGVEAEEAA